jgi:hypothetical protein
MAAPASAGAVDASPAASGRGPSCSASAPAVVAVDESFPRPDTLIRPRHRISLIVVKQIDDYFAA